MGGIKRWWTRAGEVWHDLPRLYGIVAIAFGLWMVWSNWTMSLIDGKGWDAILMFGGIIGFVGIGGGIALYRRSIWGKRLVGIVFALMALFQCFRMIPSGPYSLPRLLSVVGLAYGVYFVWMMDLSPPPKEADVASRS